MKGYNIIYKKRRGCIRSVIVGRPIAGLDLSPDAEEVLVREFFLDAHPSWEVVAVVPGDYSDSTAFVDVSEV